MKLFTSKVVDAFMALNEISLAEFRIKYLWDSVDYFVIAESNLTHSGNPKDLIFTVWLSKNPQLHSKVRCVVADLSRFNAPMDRDIGQREFLAQYLVKHFSNSLFIISDLDEIPSVEQVKALKSHRRNTRFPTPTTYIYGNHLIPSAKDWCKGVMGNSSILALPNAGRDQGLPKIEAYEQGHHFSYLNSSHESRAYKLSSFAHAELNLAEGNSIELFKYTIDYAINHLGGFLASDHGLIYQQKKSELSGIQRELFNFNEDYFKFEAPKYSKSARIVASMIVTSIYMLPRFRSCVHQTLILKDKNSPISCKVNAYLALTFMSALKMQRHFKALMKLTFYQLRFRTKLNP